MISHHSPNQLHHSIADTRHGPKQKELHIIIISIDDNGGREDVLGVVTKYHRIWVHHPNWFRLA
jgi:hypothetical protein